MRVWVLSLPAPPHATTTRAAACGWRGPVTGWALAVLAVLAVVAVTPPHPKVVVVCNWYLAVAANQAPLFNG